LRAALRRAAASGYSDRFHVIECDLEYLSCLPRGYFDLIWCFGVLEHLDRPREVLEQLLKAVAENGIVIVKIPRKWSTGYWDFMLTGQSPERWGLPRTLKDLFDWKGKARYYRWFTISGIKALLKDLDGGRMVHLLPIQNYSQPLGGIVLRQPLIDRLGDSAVPFLDAIDRFLRTFCKVPVNEFAILSKTPLSVRAPEARNAEWN